MRQRHSAEPDGSCRWCWRQWPCEPYGLAERADAASRLPWQESWTIRNELTRLLPTLRDDRLSLQPRVRRNHGSFD
jgi:hypothetical protein